MLERNGVKVFILAIPNRKPNLLIQEDDGGFVNIATFKNKREANHFKSAMFRLLDGLIEDCREKKGGAECVK